MTTDDTSHRAPPHRTASGPSGTTGMAMLFTAVLFAGVLAGFFLTYAFTIMPGLATIDDRAFVEAFQGLERMFGSLEHGINVPVLLGWAINPVVMAAALWAFRRDPGIRWWIVAALCLQAVTMVTTVSVNVPLNNALVAAGDPTGMAATEVREAFREDWWRAWNLVRTWTSVGTFACVTWALVRNARTRG